MMDMHHVKRTLGAAHIYVCALGGLFNIVVMMAVNLIGFAVGVDGILVMLSGIAKIEGMAFILSIMFSLYSFVIVQYGWESRLSARLIVSEKAL